MARGRFITLEGGEGAGKSTQAVRLEARLRGLGHTVLRTREPGGSPGAEAIRALVVRGEADRWSPLTETLLMYAARRDHLERTILPALAAGTWVVCDRFYDSTRAYQGGAGGVDGGLIGVLESAVVSEARPDLTLILDLPESAGLARADAGQGETRFEAKGAAFHARLRAAFAEIARREPERCRLIDAEGSVEAVEARLWAAVEERLGPHG